MNKKLNQCGRAIGVVICTAIAGKLVFDMGAQKACDITQEFIYKHEPEAAERLRKVIYPDAERES